MGVRRCTDCDVCHRTCWVPAGGDSPVCDGCKEKRMDRRTFFGLAAVAPAVLSAGPDTPDASLRAVFRRDPGAWTRVRMYELKVGDVFVVEGVPGLHVARGNPFAPNTVGCPKWSIDCDTRRGVAGLRVRGEWVEPADAAELAKG